MAFQGFSARHEQRLPKSGGGSNLAAGRMNPEQGMIRNGKNSRQGVSRVK